MGCNYTSAPNLNGGLYIVYKIMDVIHILSLLLSHWCIDSWWDVFIVHWDKMGINDYKNMIVNSMIINE